MTHAPRVREAIGHEQAVYRGRDFVWIVTWNGKVFVALNADGKIVARAETRVAATAEIINAKPAAENVSEISQPEVATKRARPSKRRAKEGTA